MKRFVFSVNMRLTYFFRAICLSIILIISCSGLSSAKVIFVNSKAAGSNNGSSWTNAYTDLQSALRAASPGDSIWVAEGTYYSTSTTDSLSFQIPDGVKVFGGFAGNETNFNSRDYKKNVTILNGGNISYHVVYFLNTGSSTALDGFTIKGGWTDTLSSSSSSFDNSILGGGILIESTSGLTCSPIIDNCLINGNHGLEGGGVCIFSDTGGYSSPTLNQCNISDNDGGIQLNNSQQSQGSIGAGVSVLNAGTTKLNITNCTISKDSATMGGGIGIYNFGINTASKVIGTIKNCVISNNLGLAEGGGIINFTGGTSSNPSIISVTIDSCTISDNKSGSGGGIFDFNVENSQCIPVFANCKITGNTAIPLTFASNLIPGIGGGISNMDCGPGPTFTNCTISGDSAVSGGGISNLNTAASSNGQQPFFTSIFTGCKISGNYASNNGGGIFSMSPGDTLSASLTNCIISGNYANVSGGGIYNVADTSTYNSILASAERAVVNSNIMSTVRAIINSNITNTARADINSNEMNAADAVVNYSLMNCTITGNYAGANGGAMYNKGSETGFVGVCNTTVENSIIWNNEASHSTTSSDASVTDSVASPAFSYSLVANSISNSGTWIASLGTDDGHNIDKDPLFKSALDPSTAPSSNGDFHLQLGSPALGTGSPATDPGVPKTDIDGNPRPLPSTDTNVDIGAYEENHNATNIKDDALHGPKKFMLEQNYPNPFNPTTTIKYDIPKASYVTLKVYDILGNVVKTLVDKEQVAGNYQIQFAVGNRQLASGVYLYRLQAGSFVQTKKMILLK